MTAFYLFCYFLSFPFVCEGVGIANIANGT